MAVVVTRVRAMSRDRSASGVRALAVPASRGECRETAGQYRGGARPVAIVQPLKSRSPTPVRVHVHTRVQGILSRIRTSPLPPIVRFSVSFQFYSSVALRDAKCKVENVNREIGRAAQGQISSPPLLFNIRLASISPTK